MKIGHWRRGHNSDSDLLDDRSEKTVLPLEAAFVFRKETVEIME